MGNTSTTICVFDAHTLPQPLRLSLFPRRKRLKLSRSEVELDDARGLALQDVVTHVPLWDLARGAAGQVVRPDEDARWDLELRQPLARERCKASSGSASIAK